MITFYKYHGAGNDFIMIDNLKGDIKFTPEYIASLCDRHFGIGADGIILLEASDKADCFMNYYNADGTTAQMCGNGVRCTAKFFIEKIKLSIKELNIDTRAGVKSIKINKDDTYSVDMGVPVFKHFDFPNKAISLNGFTFKCVSMGNPHAVTMVKNLENIDIKTIGPKIENNNHFPNKINVEFVEKISDHYYKVKVWERGCGETLACGTGACAVYSIITKKCTRPCLTQKEITLEFPGGRLYLSENNKGHVLLRGPATFVFKGEKGELKI